MKSLIVPLAGLAMLAATAGAATAAPPEYCALYAREYANQFAAAAGEKPGSEQKIQDEAYYRCLNQDEDPPMPSTSAYSGTSVDTAGQGTPPDPVTGSIAPERDNAAAPDRSDAAAAPAETPPPKAATRTADSGPVKRSYTSGKQPGTPAWTKWCGDHFPHSFNEKDGTILPFGSTRRQMCK